MTANIISMTFLCQELRQKGRVCKDVPNVQTLYLLDLFLQYVLRTLPAFDQYFLQQYLNRVLSSISAMFSSITNSEIKASICS